MMKLDAFLVDHVFQPTVDRIGIEPRDMVWPAYRLHVVGVVGSYLVIWGTVVPALIRSGASVMSPGLLLIGIMLQMVLIKPALMTNGPQRFDIVMVMLRLTMVTTTICYAFVLAFMLLTSRHLPFTLAMALMVFVSSWGMAAVALYMMICRPPPPRRPGAARKMRFA